MGGGNGCWFGLFTGPESSAEMGEQVLVIVGIDVAVTVEVAVGTQCCEEHLQGPIVFGSQARRRQSMGLIPPLSVDTSSIRLVKPSGVNPSSVKW